MATAVLHELRLSTKLPDVELVAPGVPINEGCADAAQHEAQSSLGKNIRRLSSIPLQRRLSPYSLPRPTVLSLTRRPPSRSLFSSDALDTLRIVAPLRRPPVCLRCLQRGRFFSRSLALWLCSLPYCCSFFPIGCPSTLPSASSFLS